MPPRREPQPPPSVPPRRPLHGDDPLTTTGSGQRRAAVTAKAPAPPPGGESRRRPSMARRWQWLAAVVGVLAVFATCGAFSYRLVQDELNGQDAQANQPEPPATIPRDITSQEVDPDPLTVDEVFPNEEIVVNTSEPPYIVLGTEESDDCGVAAADAMAELLGELGCSQVVRATLRSPTEEYVITGGIVNLATEADAERAYDDIKPLIDDGTGRFLGLLAGEGTEAIVLSETVASWDFRGHYLMYVLIARADGEQFSDADNRYADLIAWDVIEVHMRSGVLEQRATQPNPEAAGATPSAPPAEPSPPADGE